MHLNVYALGKYEYYDFRKQFQCSEEFWKYYTEVKPFEIQRILKVSAKNFAPFWFHQGFDLYTFNVLESSIKNSFKLLCQNHPDHDVPTTIQEWEKHVRMQVLMYGAYFESFHPQGKQFVGGGADVISVNWL